MTDTPQLGAIKSATTRIDTQGDKAAEIVEKLEDTYRRVFGEIPATLDEPIPDSSEFKGDMADLVRSINRLSYHLDRQAEIMAKLAEI